MKNQVMFWKVIPSVLFGCVISTLVQAQVTSKVGVQERKSEVSESYASSVPTPTIQNVQYGKHARNVVDIWQAEEKSPTPLVLVIHGGGWRGGAKERVDRFVDVQALLNAGISVAALNYRFVDQANREGVEPPVKAPLHDAARCLQFIRSKAKLWNIGGEGQLYMGAVLATVLGACLITLPPLLMIPFLMVNGTLAAGLLLRQRKFAIRPKISPLH